MRFGGAFVLAHAVAQHIDDLGIDLGQVVIVTGQAADSLMARSRPAPERNVLLRNAPKRRVCHRLQIPQAAFSQLAQKDSALQHTSSMLGIRR